MKKTTRSLWQSLKVTLVLMVVCGLIYPLVLTGIGYVFFPNQAKGNLVTYNDQVVGSKYIGQQFTKPYFLWSRPSAVNYNIYVEKDGKKQYLDGSEFEEISSGSDNFGNSNPDLKQRVENDIQAFLKAHPYVNKHDVPNDMVTASGSGLDPDISLESALLQVDRIVANSNLTHEQVRQIIQNNTTDKLFNVFGTQHVNVLAVNIDIAKAIQQK